LTGQVRAISEVTQAIASGDMTRKIEVHAEGEILLLKDTINDLVTRLDNWSMAVSRVAREVGVLGIMGGQAPIDGIAGRWKEVSCNAEKEDLWLSMLTEPEITTDVNTMVSNR